MGSGPMRRAPRAPDNPENTLRAGFTFRTPGPRPASRDLSRGLAPRPPPREFAPPHPFRMSRKKFILALDQGTTSSRALIFEHRGRIRASAQEAFTPHFPKPGWVEHCPADLWATTRRTALAALVRAKLTGASVAALRLTNQRETTVLWDRATGRPLAPAIVWQDRRTAPLCARLRRRGLEPLFRARTRLLLDPYSSGTKLAWLLDRLPCAPTPPAPPRASATSTTPPSFSSPRDAPADPHVLPPAADLFDLPNLALGLGVLFAIFVPLESLFPLVQRRFWQRPGVRTDLAPSSAAAASANSSSPSPPSSPRSG